MPIEAVVSSSPCLEFEAESLPKELRSWQTDLQGEDGARCWWIVPTSRRRRQTVQRIASAAMLPRVLSLDGLLQHLTGYARFVRPLLGNTGRLIRIARAWREAHGADAPLTPGRVLQLDQIAAEWRDSGSAPAKGTAYGKFASEFAKILKQDGCSDRPGWIELLTKELADSSSPLAGLVRKAKCIFFDGFHRFSKLESSLIEALAQSATVRLWLVGGDGQSFHANVDAVLKQLRIANPIPDARPAPCPLAKFGRSLFTDSAPAAASLPLDVWEAEGLTAGAEVAAIAGEIKRIKQSWGTAGRLADMAVVVPDDSYIALVRSTFAAAGIACAPAAEVFGLAASRPARVLLAALRIVRHGWPIEALFDFLRQPLIARQLEPKHLLNQLYQLSPHKTLGRDWPAWRKSWLDAIGTYEISGGDEDEKRNDDSANRPERAAELRGLVESIGQVLEPVRRLQKELAATDGADPANLAAAIGRLLHEIKMSNWLSAGNYPNWQVVPAREWEIDQLAFNNLKDVLGELAATPIEDFPRDGEKNIDVELVLQLALAAEQFQTSAEDDAGVQILRPRTIRGSRFRAIFAVGMVEGKVPPSDAEDLPADDDGILKTQREERAHEQQYLFTQLFESASQRLILSRPQKEGDTELMESPFFRRVKEKLGIKEGTKPPVAISSAARAILLADRLSAEEKTSLQNMLDARATWQGSRQNDAEMRIKNWALPLLQLRYPSDRLFSATALEKYASCPFQHFALKTLGLDELERDDTALRTGLFVHKVVEDFFNAWRGLPGRPSFSREQARPVFQRVFQDEWEKLAGALDSTLEHDYDKALTEAFLAITSHLVTNGFEQVEAEWEFTVDIPDNQGRTIKLYGKIDRIDRRKSDPVELICDFKTGKVPKGKKLIERLERGRQLQLPLYARAREIAEETSVKHGVYVQLNRRVDGEPSKVAAFMVNVGTLLPPPSRATPIEFDPTKAGNLAVKLAHDMRGGRISLTEYDVDHRDPACGTFCSARHACRQPKGY